ncbi:MAG: hypothetical protein HYW47_03980 [Deltaproteobacteria bacterium]|nr:hypothetical protein [Deltaproteobacteria bacterium]
MVQLYVGFVLVLIFVGVSFKRKPKIHVPIMISCLVLDLSAVLYLEITRNAVMEAIEHAPEFLMQIHLVFAVTTLVGYGVAATTGTLLLKGKRVRHIHKTNAVIFLLARIGVFITSFWVPVSI